MKKQVLCGIDRLTRADGILRGRRLGLITNPSGVLRDLTPTYLELFRRYDLRALFGPEHGIRGNAEAGGKVADTRDPDTGLPVYSLYGDHRAPTAEMLADIDVLCYDIGDVGARFYTYLYTMTRSMKAAAKAGIPFLVFDRMNPLSLSAVEGETLDEQFSSFVGEYAIPTRYGMTAGEFARYINETRQIGADLTVIPCEGLSRELYFDDTDLSFVPPSPNMPNPETALLYIGTCIFESVSDLSEGRGTANPFALIGAPFVNARALAEEMNRKDLPGVRFRAAHFTPAASKFAGEVCGGVHIHVYDRHAFSPFAMGVLLFETLRENYPLDIRELPNKRLFGTSRLYDGVPAETIIAEAAATARRFGEETKPYRIYS